MVLAENAKRGQLPTYSNPKPRSQNSTFIVTGGAPGTTDAAWVQPKVPAKVGVPVEGTLFVCEFGVCPSC